MKKFKLSYSSASKEMRIILYLLIAMIAFVTIINTISRKESPLPWIISFAIFLAPFVIGYIWMSTYKINVNDKEITVDSFFRKKYTIDVSEIKKIKWKKAGLNENIVIKTEKHKFSVATMMDNFNKMSAFIKENVNEEKISVSNINTRGIFSIDRLLDNTIDDLKTNPNACTMKSESNPSKQLSEFIDYFCNSDLIDNNYVENETYIKEKDIESCSYNEICTLLTSIIRGDRFVSGLIYSKFKDGTLLKLLESLKKLSK